MRFVECDRCHEQHMVASHNYTQITMSGEIYDLCMNCAMDFGKFMNNVPFAESDKNNGRRPLDA